MRAPRERSRARPSHPWDQGSLAMPHKFKLGDRVRLHHERSVSAAHGAYLVMMQLPERDGGYEYRIRSPDEPHERIARESELREA